MTRSTDGLARFVEDWRPSSRTDIDPLPATRVAALSAVLGEPTPVAVAGEALPPLWQWLHFLDWPARHDLGSDGHPRDGAFLPPVPDRRRMIAGGRLRVERPLELGVSTTRTSSLAGTAVKRGNTGEMLFVTVRQEFHQDERLCLVEEQDFVYRSGEDAGRAAAFEGIDPTRTPAPDTTGATWEMPASTDPVLLFRFSALTANAHRIHYDEPYCRRVEGYPGLVVHGPLLVLLMLEPARRGEQVVESVSYRLRRPVFCGEPLLVTGEPGGGAAAMRVETGREDRHATAEVRYR
jgi:3-methylfumaryl-CoA hydratase